MATYGAALIDGGNLVAGANMSNTAALAGLNGSAAFLGGKLSVAADRTVLVCSTGNEKAFCVINNQPVSGGAVECVLQGITKMMYGGTVTRGDLLELDSSGRFVTSTTTGHIVVGEALESGAVNEVHTGNFFGTEGAYLHP
jgi:hypothetical protein